LKLLEKEGSYFDIVSSGELFRLNRIGVDPKKIIYSGVGKTVGELEMAVDQGIFALVIESPNELELLSKLVLKRGSVAHILLRVNPEIDAQTHPYISTGLSEHKFGLDPKGLELALQLIGENPLLEMKGIGFHIGSQILDVEPFEEAFSRIISVADATRAAGFVVEFIDIGGGFGIPYGEEAPLDLTRLARSLADQKRGYQILMEPGRFIVGNAGVLLNQLLYCKHNYDKDFLIVDGAMNDLIRPALYGAYHRILPLVRGSKSIKADVVGPICETADFFARNRELPFCHEGEFLAVMDAGAYGFVASSNYNSRRRAAEVLINGGRYFLIRERETLQDLVRGEKIE
jgi:diaminopimelate decarboxylase